MRHLTYFDMDQLKAILSERSGEDKLGTHFELISPSASLETSLTVSEARFVLFGIPEDLGVRANFGNRGAQSTWEIVRNSLCNLPFVESSFPKNIVLLGNISTSALYNRVDESTSVDQLRRFTSELDEMVAEVVFAIVSAGKIPVAVGGGHNNAFGLLKGTSKALKQSINAINLDAHTDLRHLEGRHSGNPFSYALAELILDRYAVLGVQEALTQQYIWDFMIDKNDQILCQTYDAICLREEYTFDAALNKALSFVNQKKFGVELDVDSIANFPSSAESSSGWSIEQARRYVSLVGKNENASYLHLCEGIIRSTSESKYAKALALLILDFCKSRATA